MVIAIEVGDLGIVDQLLLQLLQRSGGSAAKEEYIYSGHKWANKTIEEINFPQKQLVILPVRNEEKIIPDGDTVVL